MTEPTVAGTLARVARELGEEPLDDATRAAVGRALLDWFAVTLAGCREVPARGLATGLATAGGPARLVGRAARADASVAALVNGTAAHTLELDDIYAPGLFHPGAPIIAAALAVAETVDASGSRLQGAVAAGFEVGCRVAVDLGPQHYRAWHTTGTAGAVGAAAAAGCLLDLDETRLVHAIALGATMAGGLQQTFRTDAMGKPLHAGHAAQSGVVAAMAAAHGVTGAGDVLEGDAGLGAATGAPSAWDASRAPGTVTPVVQHITVKPYPCCGHTFAAVDAVLQLRAAGLRAEEVQHIDVATYATALDVAGIAAPATPAEARFSIAYAVAAAMLDGRLTRSSFGLDRLEDEDLRALLATVRLEVDPQFDSAFPARRGAAVTVTTRSGAHLSATVPDRSGSPENPLTDAALAAKFADLAAPVLPDGRWRELEESLRGLSGTRSVRSLPLSR